MIGNDKIFCKKKILFLILLSIRCFLNSDLCFSQQYPFQDTTLDIETRVSDLIGRLTIDEKLSLLEHQNPAISRLGLKPYSWWNEALHGVGRNGTATVWPMPIALAASFDYIMVEHIFVRVAAEAHKKYCEAQAQGNYGDYAGLTFFTPNINIFRDPRWGRGMETYGEDPFLTATMGLACVEGLQHGDSDKSVLSAAACLKHLAVHSGPEGTRHQFDANVSQRDLWTTYLPAFEYIIAHSDVRQVMCGYNRLNGSPCCTNRELLVDILRNKWKYDGIVVTDCCALNDYWAHEWATPDRNVNYDIASHPQRWENFKQFTYNQIYELTHNYGDIDILWLDGGWVRPEWSLNDETREWLGCYQRIQDIDIPRIAAMARKDNPDLIIVDRSVGGKYENYRTPEQQVPDSLLSYPWETCMSMGDSWSYVENDNYKSTRKLIHTLIDIVAKGGNYLLNVGPDADGKLPETAIQRMKEIGEWLKKNGYAIYGTRPLYPYAKGNIRYTQSKDGKHKYEITLLDDGEYAKVKEMKVKR